MLTRRTLPTVVLAFIAAIAAFVLLALHGDATKARSDVGVRQTVGQAGSMARITPAEADQDRTNWHITVGDQSAD
jgi:archaellin